MPPPRLHRHRYHGVLAPNARLRARVTVLGREDLPDPSLATPTTPSRTNGKGSPSSPARYRWATLLARIYEVLPLRCPACGGEMKVLAFITDALTVRRILRHLGISPRPPPVAPAQRPPQQELEFDQTSAFDPTEPEPSPELPTLRSGEPAV